MTREQTAAVLGVLKIAYPNSFNHITKTDAENLIGLWSSCFEHDNGNDVMQAAKEYINTDTSGFAPTIGQIRNKMCNSESDYAFLNPHSSDEIKLIEAAFAAAYGIERRKTICKD